MRKAVKNILYTTVNSGAYENEVSGGLPGWQKKLYTVSGIILALAVLGEALVLREYFKKKKNA